MAQDVDDVDALSGAVAVVENWVREFKSQRLASGPFTKRDRTNGLRRIGKSAAVLCQPLNGRDMLRH